MNHPSSPRRLDLLLMFFVLWLACVPAALLAAQDMSGMPGMATPAATGTSANKAAPKPDAAMDGEMAAKMLADKRESERNHHLAGFFVVLAGAFILLQEKLAARWASVRYAWPVCFLASGFFVLIFSDTEIWPFGHKPLWTALTTDPEVLQHKTFALILLALGVVELERASGRLRARWAALIFPVFALGGAGMLLVHSHKAGMMHGADGMALMEHIQMQHRWYAGVGAGIAVSKGISDLEVQWRRAFNALWPSLMIILGISLMFYTE